MNWPGSGATFHFILEGVDPATECIVATTRLEVNDLRNLKAIVDPEGTEEDFRHGYELEPDDIARIHDEFGIRLEPSGLRITLRSAQPFDDLPYKSHNGRELDLMLTGTKPLAFFTNAYPEPPHFTLPEHLFDPYVVQGRFAKRDYVLLPRRCGSETAGPRGTRVLLYSLKHEEWRIDTLALLLNTAQKVEWNEGFERLLGSLLGYEEWQNDAYIDYLRRCGQQAG